MSELWVTSQAGLTDLEEIGVRVPKSETKKIAALVWVDTETETCAVGAVAYTDKSELQKKTFPLKSNLDYGKVLRIVKFEERRRQ